MPRDRGTGSIFKKPGSDNYYVQYYIDGRRARESTGTSDKNKARKILQDRIASVAQGNFLGPAIDRVTVREIVEDFLNSPTKKDSKTWHDDNDRWENHLLLHIGHVRASRVTTSLLNTYITKRKAERIRMATREGDKWVQCEIDKYPANGTVNRELSLLRASFNYARKSSPPKVAMVPNITLLPESKPRSGFLKDDEYDALASACAAEGLWMRATFELYVTYGWRKSEVVKHLRVSQCDVKAGVLRLNPGETKNKKGRPVILTQKLRELLAACVEGKKPNDYLITRNGKPIGDFRKTWESVCGTAGVPGLLLHDLRRTGVRNMRRMGIHEGTIMKIAGLKTRSIFDRYDISDMSDINDAVRKMDERNAQRDEERKSQNSPSSAPVEVKSPEVELEQKVN